MGGASWAVMDDIVDELVAAPDLGALAASSLAAARRLVPSEGLVSLFDGDSYCRATTGAPDRVRRSYNDRYRFLIGFMTPSWGPSYFDGTCDLMDYRRFPRAEFVADFALPNGIASSLSVYRPGNRYTPCVTRGPRDPAFRPGDRAALAVLTRHLNGIADLHLRLAGALDPPGGSCPAAEVRPPQKTPPRSQLSPRRTDRCLERLRRLMEEEKSFLDPDLSLPRLAQRLGVPRNALSELLNRRLGTGYADYVNGLRVAEARRLLADGRGPLNILSVAYAVGFNSKTAFYDHFKRTVGRSPSEFAASPFVGSLPKR